MQAERCCNCNGDQFVVDAGYITCIGCGQVQSHELNENACSYDHAPTHSLKTNYTRIKRFKTKILGGLNRRLHHKIDEEVLTMLRKRLDPVRPVSPEQFLDHLTSLEIGRRKPYIHVCYYFEAVYGVRLPIMPRQEEATIALLFHEIFFANDRLQLIRPTFPMATLLRLIVDHFQFSLQTQLVARFAKRLRCERRRRRYRQMFQTCCAYILNDNRTKDQFRGLQRRKTTTNPAAVTPEMDAGASYHIAHLGLSKQRCLSERERDAGGSQKWDV